MDATNDTIAIANTRKTARESNVKLVIMRPGNGFFVTFEGLDGTGKTTQIQRLSQHLQASGQNFAATRQPGGTEIGNRIRALLLDSKNTGLSPLAELGLMFSDRAQSLHEIILPALHAGKVVLCDRYTDSSEAYQGYGRELGSEIVLALHRELCGGLQPHLTFLLLGNPELDLARAQARNANHNGVDENRFEAEHKAFHDRVLRGFQAIAERDHQRVVKIDAARSIEEVHAEIAGVFDTRIKNAIEAVPSVHP